MATSPALSVDVLSSDERKLVVMALEQRLASLGRSVRSAPSDDVAKAFEAEVAKVSSLASKFR